MSRSQVKRQAIEHSQSTRSDTQKAAGAQPADRAEVASYVAHMAQDLSAMSAGAGYPLLAYLLDMAREEARVQAGPRQRR